MYFCSSPFLVFSQSCLIFNMEFLTECNKNYFTKLLEWRRCNLAKILAPTYCESIEMCRAVRNVCVRTREYGVVRTSNWKPSDRIEFIRIICCMTMTTYMDITRCDACVTYFCTTMSIEMTMWIDCSTWNLFDQNTWCKNLEPRQNHNSDSNTFHGHTYLNTFIILQNSIY